MAVAKSQSLDYFLQLASMVMEITGVQLTEKQRPMIEARITRRISELGLNSIEKYFTYFLQNKSDETNHLITILTTHHTFFFREFIQFEYLIEVLPRLVLKARQRADKKIRIWSAGCSRGHEVYSLAMFLKYHLGLHAPDIQFEILGTDIDQQSITIAKNGVYGRKEISEVPLIYLGQNWVRGTEEIVDYVKAKSSLKNSCHFEVVNLLNLPAHIQNTKFDVIFCRNVFIYFKTEQVAAISETFLNLLSENGYFFVGVSESLKGLKIESENVGPSVYTLPKEDTKKPVPQIQQQKNIQVRSQAPLRVMCIDDSISILTLMNQILTAEEGFQIVATAKNGLEAAKKIKEIQVDIVTLDIHMPEQNGIEYLEKNLSSQHPPVVMVTAVSRDDSDLAMRSLHLGAMDYVEKPTLSNFNERADEIRTKLRSAHHAKKNSKTISLELDQSFQRHSIIQKLDQKQRLIVASLSDREKIAHLVKELNSNQPPTYILIEGAGAVLHAFAQQLSRDCAHPIQHQDILPQVANPGTILIGDFKNFIPQISLFAATKKTSVIIFGQTTKFAGETISQFKNAQILVEENSGNTLTSKATDQVQYTSFAYLSNQFLSGDK